MPNKIKATVITGFLGAGKTTFINNLIKKYPEVNFALVENEFGEVAIDTHLIKGIDAGRMFELKNGCLCCTILNEYELILLELADRFPETGHLIIETTGIADPVPVIRPFFNDNEIQKYYKFNGTICLVDGINYGYLPVEKICHKQIAIADLVLVNKSGKISKTGNNTLEKEIHSINPLCEIQFVTYGDSKQVDFYSLINKKIDKFPRYELPGHSYINITVKILIFQSPLNKEKFIDWLSYNLDIYKAKIFRVKGIVYFENEPFKYILQAVGGNFELVEEGFYSDPRKSEIVFIGELAGITLKF